MVFGYISLPPNIMILPEIVFEKFTKTSVRLPLEHDNNYVNTLKTLIF